MLWCQYFLGIYNTRIVGAAALCECLLCSTLMIQNRRQPLQHFCYSGWSFVTVWGWEASNSNSSSHQSMTQLMSPTLIKFTAVLEQILCEALCQIVGTLLLGINLEELHILSFVIDN